LQKEATVSPYKSSLVKKERQLEVVALTEADVQRMKSDAHIMTAEERSTLRHEIEERKEHERAAAKARKEKMMHLAAEAKKQVRAQRIAVQAGLSTYGSMQDPQQITACRLRRDAAAGVGAIKPPPGREQDLHGKFHFAL
jgi:hypothetical protein